MKLAKHIILTSAVFAGAVAGIHAQDTMVSITTPAATFALTTKSFVGGTFEVDENGKLTKTPAFESMVETYDKNGNLVKSVSTSAAKAVTGKLGNAEILNSVIDSLGGSIKGWSIVASSDNGNPVFMATKKGQDNVDLSDVLSADLPESGAYSDIATYTASYDTDGNVTKESTTLASSGTVEGAINFQVAGADLSGYFVQPYKGLTYNPDSTDKSTFELVNIPGAGKVTGVIGQGEDENGTILYQGSVSVAAASGKVVKLQ
jgi:hypothetical protein